MPSAGEPPKSLGLNRDALARGGFDAKPGQALVLPEPDGRLRVAVGIGDGKTADAANGRDAAAAFARAAASDAELAYLIDPAAGLDPAVAAQVAVEGILLARYSYDALKGEPAGTPVTSITLLTEPSQREAVAAGAKRGLTLARATMLARDLANAPSGAPDRGADGGRRRRARRAGRPGRGGLRPRRTGASSAAAGCSASTRAARTSRG